MLPIEKNLIENIRNATPWEIDLKNLRRKGEIKKNDLIRTSYAAFIIIEVENEYLLLKNSHGMNLYLMPGMTYRMNIDEKRYIIENFYVKNDEFIKRKFDDYRLLVPLFELKKFYKYFSSIHHPNSCYYKNIMDNIIKKCDLSENIFDNVDVAFKGRYINICYSRYTGKYEMILGDVFETRLNENQKEQLCKLKNIKNDVYRFATLDEIKSNGINLAKGKMTSDIAENAYYCFDNKLLFR